MVKNAGNKMGVWEILIPRCSNNCREYSVKYHQAWDKKVREIAGGITILKAAKGHWINPKGKLFVEEMIPVRVYCTEKDIDKIIDFTINYYKQEVIFAYKISSKMKIKHRKKN